MQEAGSSTRVSFHVRLLKRQRRIPEAVINGKGEPAEKPRTRRWTPSCSFDPHHRSFELLRTPPRSHSLPIRHFGSPGYARRDTVRPSAEDEEEDYHDYDDDDDDAMTMTMDYDDEDDENDEDDDDVVVECLYEPLEHLATTGN
ncbi:hypothetical protein HZH68_007976 [Vespula germanica]|uniref:Uncharacterized protein n=1 Tax=Vespula germanica TaxID=30212 RepID=A0A834K2W3_VESGE|nr:hypothetical protein HZH68_007976 [Vespula germanica]